MTLSAISSNNTISFSNHLNQVDLPSLKDVAVTIYQNTAQVSDFFKAHIQENQTQFNYTFSPSLYQNHPFIYLSNKEGTLLSQEYSSNVFSLESLYLKLMGSSIEVVTTQGIIYGKLVEVQSDQLIILQGAKLCMVAKKEIHSCSFDGIEEELKAQSTLKGRYVTDKVNDYVSGQVIFFTPQLKWSPQYRLILEEKEGLFKGVWQAEAELQNNSYQSLKNIQVRVVSGNLNLEGETFTKKGDFRAMACLAESNGGCGALIQNNPDYKVYLIPSKIDLNPHQSLKVPLFESCEIEIKKIHRLDSYEYANGAKRAQIGYQIDNSATSELYQAYPDGKAAVYLKQDQQIDLVGESTVPKTAQGNDITLFVGEAFDLQVNRSYQIENIKSGDKIISQIFKVKLEITNTSGKDLHLKLHEHISAQKLLKMSQPGEWNGSNELVFTVKVDSKHQVKEPWMIEYSYQKDC